MNWLTDKLKIFLLLVLFITTSAALAEFSPNQIQQAIPTAAKIQFPSQDDNHLELKNVENTAQKSLPGATTGQGITNEELTRINISVSSDLQTQSADMVENMNFANPS